MTESNGGVPREAQVLLYQTDDGSARIEVRFEGETAWMTRISLAELYQTTPQNITQLVAAIYAEGELAIAGIFQIQQQRPGKWASVAASQSRAKRQVGRVEDAADAGRA